METLSTRCSGRRTHLPENPEGCLTTNLQEMSDVMTHIPSDPERDTPGSDWYRELEHLALRHEMGEVSDDEFAREKARILREVNRPHLGASPLQLIVATYATETDARSAFDQLGMLNQDVIAGIVDAAVLARERSGVVRVAAYGSSVTSKSGEHRPAIGTIARVMFPPSLVSGVEPGPPRDSSVDALRGWQADAYDLRAMGNRVLPGEAAIIAVVHSQEADEVVSHLQSYMICTRHMLHPSIANAMLGEATDDHDADAP